MIQKIKKPVHGQHIPVKMVAAIFIVVALSARVLFAAEPIAGDGPQPISWSFLFIGLFGGLALFLYGMEKMSEGLKKSAGNKMRSILSALTQNRIIGLMVGAFVTMVIQSSSATTVMLVSFVQAELMTFAQTLEMILGAGIGATMTGQLIAFNLSGYALLMVTIGFFLRMFGKNMITRNIGEILFGFGLLFYGMKLMSDAMTPLRNWPDFINLMKSMENPLMGLLVGVVLTSLIQSSGALIGIIIVLAQQGLITLEAGIPLIFGANIGTCVTAGLASIGTSREAKRVALIHVVFKIGGVLLFIFWIPVFADFIRMIAEKLGSDAGRQIANVHTIFNVSLALIFLPFTTLFAALLFKILPKEEVPKELVPSTYHLDESMLATPEFAIGLARKEISRMAQLLGRMLRAVIIPFMSDAELISREVQEKDEAALLVKEIPVQDEIFPHLTLREGLDMREEKIDYLDEMVGDYLIRLARQELSNEQVAEVYGMISITKDLESIGDIIHRNFLPLMDKKEALKADFSDEGKEELMIYHVKVCKQISRLKEAFAENNSETAQRIMAKEGQYLDLESKYRLKHLERLHQAREKSVTTHEIHMELMDLLKRVNVYAGNIAKTFLGSMKEKNPRA